MINCTVFDFEVFAHDWLVVFKELDTGIYTVFHNDNHGVQAYMQMIEPLLCGFNNKHYDQFIMKCVLDDRTPEEIKQMNDFIIGTDCMGWDHPWIKESKQFFRQFDLKDDAQDGVSLKGFEAHSFMNIKESTVPFDLPRKLTDDELSEVIDYCKYDVDATEKLLAHRENYIKTKLTLGAEIGIPPHKALYMTNAKLTAAYLKASPKKWDDERSYSIPDNLLQQYIPTEVLSFFALIGDKSIPDDEIFKTSLQILVGNCPTTLAYGGIHGAIPTYREVPTDTRTIRNQDVGSYYPHLMIHNKYCSRNIQSPDTYANMVKRRMEAKKNGDMDTANALKLVANTSYGAMLNKYNDLFDPLMGRSVCVSGQLYLLELAMHLVADCKTLEVIQLNTDGVMVSLDNSELDTYYAICNEWQERTLFTLEEDTINLIVQKDVNNYLEVDSHNHTKIKGGFLVRGENLNGAYTINNTATIIPKAIVAYLQHGTPPEETINACNDLQEYQIIAKVGGKYSKCVHLVDGVEMDVQKCNRIYATSDTTLGKIYKYHAIKKTIAQEPSLPDHCIIDNENTLDIGVVDKGWYAIAAWRKIYAFQGIKAYKKRNTRRLNKEISEILKLFPQTVD